MSKDRDIDEQVIQVEYEEQIVRLVLNRPKQLNALNDDIRQVIATNPQRVDGKTGYPPAGDIWDREIILFRERILKQPLIQKLRVTGQPDAIVLLPGNGYWNSWSASRRSQWPPCAVMLLAAAR